jgi:hypothetical protein
MHTPSVSRPSGADHQTVAPNRTRARSFDRVRNRIVPKLYSLSERVASQHKAGGDGLDPLTVDAL